MNFDLGPDERALQEAFRELCARQFSLSRAGQLGIDRDGWRALTDAGLFSLRVPEDRGGLGLGMTEAVVVFEELGRWVVPGPLAATHCARTLGAPEDVLGVVERGETMIEHLDFLDVVAVLDDEGVWRVAPSDVQATPVEGLDPLTPVHRVRALPQGKRIASPETAARLRAEVGALHAATLAGIASQTADLAVAYAKERTQFGRAIGSFQAVKHLCADMLVRAEIARAAAYAAGCALDEERADGGARVATGAGEAGARNESGAPGADARRAVATAKLLAGEAALANAKACIQVHGGMGYTWEVPAHLYLKRAAVLASAFGTARENEEAMADAL